jgi:hypothetical protein
MDSLAIYFATKTFWAKDHLSQYLVRNMNLLFVDDSQRLHDQNYQLVSSPIAIEQKLI